MVIGVLGRAEATAWRRAARLIFALAVAGFAGLVLAGGSVQAASSLSVSRSSGLALPRPVTVTYTGPTDSGATCDPGADFTWDGFELGVAGGTKVGSACRYQTTVNVPIAGHNAAGLHTIAAVECSNLSSCDREAEADAAFTVDAPTITIAPTSGYPRSAFTAVMTVPSADCGAISSVQFRWHSIAGVLLGSPVFNTATCSATQTGIVPPAGSAPGAQNVTGMLCLPTVGCSTELAAAQPATYTILRPPTGKVAPTNAAPPSENVSQSPGPSPSPISSPTDAGVAGAPTTASPSVSSAPTAAPTPALEIVEGVTFSTTTWLPPLVQDVPGSSGLDLAPGVLATNALLALVFMLLFALTAEVLNNTLDDHREVIAGWVGSVGGRLGVVRGVASLEAGFDNLAAHGRAGAIAHGAAVLLLLGLVYGFLSPEFGPDGAGLVLVLSVMLGLGVLLYTNYGLKALIVRRLHRTPAGVRTYGLAILVAAVCVTFSRFLDFHPGIVYGFVASLAVLAPLELSRRDQARMILIAMLAVLGVGLAAFVLLDPLRSAIGDSDAFLPSLAESVLVILYVGSLEGLAVNLLPVTYLDGAKVFRWSRIRWAVGYWLVLFLWWQLLFNRDQEYADAFRQSSVLAVAAMLVFFMLTTVVVWTFFRVRDERRERAEQAASASGPDLPESQSATADVGSATN